ncbi:hypothetical protein [Hymenobacter koreensis]|uniref:Uncharacterized protein n=1 Tax=Hymenobacter koreensis TaxID=1084523 RepID=A0ABP8JKC7_9BACT
MNPDNLKTATDLCHQLDKQKGQLNIINSQRPDNITDIGLHFGVRGEWLLLSEGNLKTRTVAAIYHLIQEDLAGQVKFTREQIEKL